MRNDIRAILTEEELLAAENETLARVRAAITEHPERFVLRAPPLPLPAPRRRRDLRRMPPDPLRLSGKAALPSRLPWASLPRPEGKPRRVRLVPEPLPAEQLTARVKHLMKERRVSQDRLARALYCSPVTLRRWFASPADMTIRDYRALAAWAGGAAQKKGGRP